MRTTLVGYLCGDANSNLLRTRTFCSELFTRQTHTPIDWKFHCASFAVWVCRLNISLQRVTAVQTFGNKNYFWGFGVSRRQIPKSNFWVVRTFCSELFSRQTHTPIDWKFHCASFGVWVCRVEIPVKENMEVRKFYREIFWYTGSQSK